MKYQFFIADVFTNELYNGAQVAVLPKANGLTDAQMQKIARETNLSETVFLFNQQDSLQTRRMRTFSPHGEIGFAGHPVLAAAFVSTACGEMQLSEADNDFVFEQNAGPVNVNVSNNNGAPGFIQFSRQVSPIVDYYAPPESELAEFLGIDETHIDNKKYCTRLVSCGLPYLVVPVFYFDALRKAKINFSKWSQSIAPQTAAQEILMFSPKTPNKDSDFAVRLFGPKIGIHEDPPVGSAMGAFASYLCSFEHMRVGTYTFSVERGDEQTRRSVLNLEMDHKKEDQLMIRIGGEAVMVAEGYMDEP